MASTLALDPVCAAFLADLKADSALTARVPAARIVDDGRPTMPYVLVEGIRERPFNTMGPAEAPKWGGVASIRVRVVSQYRGESEVRQIMSLIKARRDGQELAVTGYPTAIVQFQQVTLLTDTIAGVTTRELVADFDVTAHQS